MKVRFSLKFYFININFDDFIFDVHFFPDRNLMI